MSNDPLRSAAPSEDELRHAIPIRDWLVGEARFIETPDVAVLGLVERLHAIGVPVDRMASAMPTLHAERRGLGRIWTREDGVRELPYPWGQEAEYEASPYYVAHQTRAWVRLRLTLEPASRFGIARDLKAAGYTDYVCIPIFLQDGDLAGMTFATQHVQGFSDHDLAVLRTIESACAILFDLKRSWRVARETLRMYVGTEPRDRILSGQVQRGDTIPIRAAILFADMRGFTARSSRLDAAATVALLNRFFDCVVPPIEAAGGEVLKYLGDGLLAIVNRPDDAAACRAALEAAMAARRAVAASGEFGMKLALHHGEVAYGNIGSGARLDYTVIGRDVNITSRLADLCGTADAPMVASAAFAARVGTLDVRPLGPVTLRGVNGPVDVVAWRA